MEMKQTHESDFETWFYIVNLKQYSDEIFSDEAIVYLNNVSYDSSYYCASGNNCDKGIKFRLILELRNSVQYRETF